MEAGVRELRDHLSRYLTAVQDGAEITVTDHGRAIAMLVPLERPRRLDQLVADGVVTRAVVAKVPRTRPRVSAGLVSDLVADQRR